MEAWIVRGPDGRDIAFFSNEDDAIASLPVLGDGYTIEKVRI